MIGFNKNESKVLVSKLEIKSILGTVKICKTFLNFNDPFHDLILPDFYTKLNFKFSYNEHGHL